jgi:SAM-dependent methyltransferase
MMESPTVVLDSLEAALEWASDRIEEAGVPTGRERNWAIQRHYQAEWMVPAMAALRRIAPCPVLDLGTAYGVFAVAAAALGCEVVGVDWHTPLPTLEVPGITWLRQDIEAPIALGGPFGCIVLLEVLEHLNCQPLGLFRRIRDALVPGGLFVGSTPDPEVWVEDLAPVALADLPQWHSSAALVDRHIRLYSPDEVTGLLKAAGFRGITQRRNGGPRYHWEATAS